MDPVPLVRYILTGTKEALLQSMIAMELEQKPQSSTDSVLLLVEKRHQQQTDLTLEEIEDLVKDFRTFDKDLDSSTLKTVLARTSELRNLLKSQEDGNWDGDRILQCCYDLTLTALSWLGETGDKMEEDLQKLGYGIS
jgi:hypothetical protein